MKLVLTEKVSKIVPQVLNRNIKSAVHSLAKLLPSTLPGKVCPIVGWNLHAGKLNVECKTRCRRKAWTSSSRGAPFFATLYDFFTAEQAFLLRGRHSFLILRDKPNPLPCCTLLLRSPFRPARTFCAALLSLPGSSNPRQNGSWQIVMCDGRLQTKADLVYAQDFVPKSGFLAESEAKITFKGSSKSLKKSHPVCSCGPRCPSHYRNDQRKAYWVEINLNFIHRAVVEIQCTTSILYLVSHGMLAHEEENFLSLPKVRHLRSPYPPSYFAEFHPAGHPPPLHSLFETNLG